MEQFKQQFLKQLEQKKSIITHCDLDAMLSLAYLHNKTSLPLKGIFDLNSNVGGYCGLYVSEEEKLNSSVFIDLSMCYKKAFSTDHHLAPFEFCGESNFNLNKIYPETKDVINNPKGFYSKCPLPTIIILMWFFNEDINKYSKEKKTLIFAADSFYKLYKQYTNNVVNWLEFLGIEYITDDLNNVTEQDVQAVKQKVGIHRSGYVHYNVNKGGFYAEETGTSLQDYLNNISKIMGWDYVKVPEFKAVYGFKNEKHPYSKIEEVLRDKSIYTCMINESKTKTINVSRYIGKKKISIKKDSLQTA